MKKLFFLAVTMIVACTFALPAMAQDKADWAWYGQTRMWTAWESADGETANSLTSNFLTRGQSAGSAARGWDPGTGILEDDDQLEWKLQTNARLGASVKWGNIGGRAEFGNNGTPQGGDFGATWRLLYGTWNFGAGTLLVGKDYTPYFFIVSGMCGPGGGECNGIGWGTIYHGRRAQLKLIMGGFQVALVEPAIVAPVEVTGGAPAIFIPDDTDQTLPAIEASYSFNLGPVGMFIGGAYNTYTVEFGTATGVDDVDIDSFALGAGARMAFGPFYVNATAQYGSNVGNLGMPTNLAISRLFFDSDTLNEEDSDYMAAQLILGFKLTDAFSLEGGVIWQNGEADAFGTDVEQEQWAYYLQAVFSPAKNVFIVPEIGLIDQGDLTITGEPDEDQGDITWIGIKWQINF